MGIKAGISKLQMRVAFATLADFMASNNIRLLPVAIAHVQRLQALPFHHRDPFDRLLITQAFAEKLTLLTRDGIFKEYGAPILW